MSEPVRNRPAPVWHSERPSGANTGAAIVSYNPDAGFPVRVLRVARHVDRVVVVDNHSHGSTIGELRARSGVDLILNKRNVGVATALNQGLQWAKQRGYQWLLTLDQDTVAHEDILDTLASVYQDIDDKAAIALIGSTSSADVQRRRKVVESGPGWVEAKTTITAGTLMWLPACDAIGPFRDELFIDLVDIEYCLRARHKGFKVFLSLKPGMDHQIGATTTHRLPWKPTGTSNHSPLRRYYMMRNHAILAGEYLLTDPRWALTSLWSRVKSTVLMCLFERDRIAKLRLTALGAWDGLTRNVSRDMSREW